MDILQVVRDKIRRVSGDDRLPGLEAVATHIETAEKYLLRAREENDANLFTDVVYRTNHAFEGILKEAYAILAGRDASKHTPYEIETYFLENSVFKPRVMELFKNYRTEWRNPSTHDHRLFFSEQEAFLAIVSVSAFVSILLDQIGQHTSFEAERARTQDRVDAIKESMPGYNSLSFYDRVKELLVAFAGETTLEASLSEQELLGLLAGFITSIDPSIEVKLEENIQVGDITLTPDLVLSTETHWPEWAEDPETETLYTIVELKVAPLTQNNVLMAEIQLLKYLQMFGSDFATGIVYFFPTKPYNSMSVTGESASFEGRSFHITRILPMQKREG